MHTIFIENRLSYLSWQISNNMKQDIPKIFYEFKTQEPFHHCIECNRTLGATDDYMIEKAFRRYPGFSAVDTIIDYAICMNCALEMRNSLSIHSRQVMDGFFAEHLSKLTAMTNENGVVDVDQCLSRCLVTGKKVADINEYQVYALCKGNQLSDMVPPYMISEEAVEMLLPLLSKETTDFLNGFMNKHFSPDPSIMEPIGPKLILI